MNKINSILFVFAILFFLISCSTASEEKKNTTIDTVTENKTDTLSVEIETETVEIDSLNANDSLFKIQFPEIDTVVEYALFRDSVIDYFNKVFVDEITKQSQIEAIFAFRNDLVVKLTNLSHSYNESTHDNYKKWDAYHIELVKFGFRPIYAEGMFTGLTIAPILENKIKTLCSKEFQLFSSFSLAEANSFGGEYPFLDLSAQIEMVLLGEKMAKKFPKSEYNRLIEKPYRFALSTLTDLHGISRNGEINEYLLQDISRDFWPNATDISYMETFVKKHYKSKFAGVVKKILSNTSELEVGEDLNVGNVFLVVVESYNEEQLAEDRVFKLLNKGIDIPHVISSKKENVEQFNVVYRFYKNKEKAEKALIKIKKKFKESKLIHIDFKWNEIDN